MLEKSWLPSKVSILYLLSKLKTCYYIYPFNRTLFWIQFHIFSMWTIQLQYCLFGSQFNCDSFFYLIPYWPKSFLLNNQMCLIQRGTLFPNDLFGNLKPLTAECLFVKALRNHSALQTTGCLTSMLSLLLPHRHRQ